jgi:hypothetical protein
VGLPALLFVVLFVLGCLLAFVRHPIFGLLTYVGVFYVHPPSRWWGQHALMEQRWSYIAAVVSLLAIFFGKHEKPVKPFGRQGFVIAFILFYLYVLLQLTWALSIDEHQRLVEYYFKYAIVMFVIYRALDTIENVWLFLWAHVTGCFYFGWIAYTEYEGGRFEGFGGPGLSEANAAALTMLTGAIVLASLFMAMDRKRRIVLAGMVPFILNGIVTTISRSAFLATAAAGLVFNLWAPKAWRGKVAALTVLGGMVFVGFTNDTYWSRIDTVKYKGAEVGGVDMSAGRLAVMQAQLRMAGSHPMGCGHSCTEFLSPSYIAQEKLNRSSGTRASHNSFLSLLVDQGFIGAAAYIGMLLWLLRSLQSLKRHVVRHASPLAPLLPGVAAVFAAMCVGDMFVPYVRYEIRFWFFGLLLAMLNLAEKERLASRAVTTP